MSEEGFMNGLIGFYKLEDWWLNELTDEDREIIEDKFEGHSDDDKPMKLTTGKPKSNYTSIFSFIETLASNHRKPEDYFVVQKIFNKADSLINEVEVVDKHFYYQTKISIHYRSRETNPDALDNAIQACLDQIALSKDVAEVFTKRYISSHDPISRLESLKSFATFSFELHEKYAQEISELESEIEKIKGKKFILDPEIKILPLHTGFQQLAIIYEKQKKYTEMIDLCIRADNEGWNGIWKKRIEKAKKKLSG